MSVLTPKEDVQKEMLTEESLHQVNMKNHNTMINISDA